MVNASTRPITMTSKYSTAGSLLGKLTPNQVKDPVGGAGDVASVWPVTGGGGKRAAALAVGRAGRERCRRPRRLEDHGDDGGQDHQTDHVRHRDEV